MSPVSLSSQRLTPLTWRRPPSVLEHYTSLHVLRIELEGKNRTHGTSTSRRGALPSTLEELDVSCADVLMSLFIARLSDDNTSLRSLVLRKYLYEEQSSLDPFIYSLKLSLLLANITDKIERLSVLDGDRNSSPNLSSLLGGASKLQYLEWATHHPQLKAASFPHAQSSSRCSTPRPQGASRARPTRPKCAHRKRMGKRLSCCKAPLRPRFILGRENASVEVREER